tara:strand:+ start:473 stop:631 length:159 start_codon:yes stop_codon:yes gene_type:complete
MIKGITITARNNLRRRTQSPLNNNIIIPIIPEKPARNEKKRIIRDKMVCMFS